MLNYTIEPALLQPLLPPGTELDFFNGTTYVSMVGFRFLRTKVFGLGIPWHRDFEEVNLRFYVRRRAAEGWRRGVAFIRELVPRRAIAFVARRLYGEPYTALPMGHRIEHTANRRSTSSIAGSATASGSRWASWAAASRRPCGRVRTRSSSPSTTGATRPAAADASEYQVEHPPWRIWSGTESYLHADVLALYGELFVEALSARPVSAFIADGSAVTVRCKTDFVCPQKG